VNPGLVVGDLDDGLSKDHKRSRRPLIEGEAGERDPVSGGHRQGSPIAIGTGAGIDY
jgi:hypothetical protein